MTYKKGRFTVSRWCVWLYELLEALIESDPVKLWLASQHPFNRCDESHRSDSCGCAVASFRWFVTNMGLYLKANLFTTKTILIAVKRPDLCRARLWLPQVFETLLHNA
jgi:hypothetical protein